MWTGWAGVLLCIVAFAASSACQNPSSVVCASGRVCNGDSVCDSELDICMLPGQREACDGLADSDDCDVAGFLGVAGSCQDGVCVQAGCGDGFVKGSEDCDGSDLGLFRDCTEVGFSESKPLTCNSDCRYEVSACSGVCGDGVINGNEQCDLTDLGVDGEGATNSCTNFGFYAPEGLGCSPACTFETSACQGSCGDGVRNGNESCDGSDIGEATCLDLGYYEAGNLACTSFCSYDPASCATAGFCGDGAVGGPELCDPGDGAAITSDLNDKVCTDLGFYHDTGTLACGQLCNYDTSQCTGFCGDGVREPLESEQCDLSAVGPGEDCVSETNDYDIGSLGCTGLCSYTPTSCDKIGWEQVATISDGFAALDIDSSGAVYVLGQQFDDGTGTEYYQYAWIHGDPSSVLEISQGSFDPYGSVHVLDPTSIYIGSDSGSGYAPICWDPTSNSTVEVPNLGDFGGGELTDIAAFAGTVYALDSNGVLSTATTTGNCNQSGWGQSCDPNNCYDDGEGNYICDDCAAASGVEITSDGSIFFHGGALQRYDGANVGPAIATGGVTPAHATAAGTDLLVSGAGGISRGTFNGATHDFAREVVATSCGKVRAVDDRLSSLCQAGGRNYIAEYGEGKWRLIDPPTSSVRATVPGKGSLVFSYTEVFQPRPHFLANWRLPTTVKRSSMSASGPGKAAFVSGAGTTVVDFDGFGLISTAVGDVMSDLYYAPTGELFAAGRNGVYKRDLAGVWSKTLDVPNGYFSGITGTSASNVFASSVSLNEVHHYGGTEWQIAWFDEDMTYESCLEEVYALHTGEVYALFYYCNHNEYEPDASTSLTLFGGSTFNGPTHYFQGTGVFDQIDPFTQTELERQCSSRGLAQTEAGLAIACGSEGLWTKGDGQFNFVRASLPMEGEVTSISTNADGETFATAADTLMEFNGKTWTRIRYPASVSDLVAFPSGVMALGVNLLDVAVLYRPQTAP